MTGLRIVCDLSGLYTQNRVALVCVTNSESESVETRNITLSLPEELLQEVEVLAARRRTSVSGLLAGMLREMVERETGYTFARRREMEALERGLDLGTGGEVSWNRDELHERR